MFNVLDFIDSEDVKEFNKDTKFTPAQQAVLIAHSIKKSVYDKVDALEELVNTYSKENFEDNSILFDKDEPFKDIIQENIDMYKTILADTSHSAIYITRSGCNKEEINESSCISIFNTFEKAYDHILNESKMGYCSKDGYKQYYKIEAVGLNEEGYDPDEFIYDDEVNLISIRQALSREEYNPFLSFLDLRYLLFNLPVPFQTGDIIVSDYLYEEVKQFGVVGKENEYNGCSPNVYEYSDKTFKNATFGHMFDLWHCRYATKKEINNREDSFEIGLLSACFTSEAMRDCSSIEIINDLNTMK